MEIVDLPWAVEAEPHQETLAGEEGAPVVIEQGAIGLQGIADDLAGGEAALVVQGPLEKVQAEQGRLAALPGELDFGAGLRRDVALHVVAQHLVVHAEALAGRELLLLLQVEAVAAIEVADRPDRLGHEVQALGRGFGIVHR
ncbi:hypothetical protein D3C76_1205160 [compost metagenome]